MAIETIPENEVEWYAGYTANHKFLSVEMCVPKSQETFRKVYENTVMLAAQICRKHGWTSKEIYSHKYCSYTWHKTDHEDPYAFLQQFHTSWNRLLADIEKEIKNPEIHMTPIPHEKLNPNAIIIASTLNIRDSARENVIGSICKNERIEVLDEKENWSYIKYNTSHGSKCGWLYSQYLI